MASQAHSKIFHQMDTASEQQENMKGVRKAFNTLQKASDINKIDKENQVIGRSPAYIAKEALIKKISFDSDQLSTPDLKRKCPATTSTSSQTSPSTSSKQVTADDLTSDKPGENFWEKLAEKRRQALEETLHENQELYERIATLEDELNQSKSMLEEAQDLVTVLTELLEEKEQNTNNEHNGSVETEEPSDVSGGNLDMTL